MNEVKKTGFGKKASKIVSLVLAAVILLFVFVTPINAKTTIIITKDTFSQNEKSMFDNDYFGIVAEDLKARGIFIGYPDGTMGENNHVTRAEMATVCTRILGVENKPNYVPTVKYPDVPDTHWAVKYVSLTNDYGITQGYPDGTFKPENNVTLNETLKMLLVSGGYGSDDTGNALSYPDGYIQAGKDLGVTNKIVYDGNRAALRGEIMFMTYQMLQADQTSQGGDDYVVKFDLNYNNPVGKIADQTVKSGSYAKRPTTENVKRANYLLTGWYTDKDCKNEFSFDTKINADVTLYAKWDLWNETPLPYEADYEISDMLNKIESKYHNNNNYVDFENFDKVMEEIIVCVQNLYEQGKILKYNYSDHTIEIVLNSRIVYGYSISNDELLNNGKNDVRIETYTLTNDINISVGKYSPLPDMAEAYSILLRGNYSASDNYSDGNVNIETLEKISGDIIFWEGHGYWSDFYLCTMLQTGIKRDKFTDNAMYTLYGDKICTIDGLKEIYQGDKYYFITPEFINSLQGSERFKGSLVYLNTCNSLRNYDLAAAFIDKGASVVIGNTNDIYIPYSRYLFINILKDLAEQDNVGKFPNTVAKVITDILLSQTNKEKYAEALKKTKNIGIGIADWFGKDNFKLSDLLNKETIDNGFIVDPTKDTIPAGAIHIKTAEELAKIGGEQSAGKYYVLDNDINLTSEWIPIDDFRGTFDGRGHSVNNLFVLRSSNRGCAGLFGQIFFYSNVTIKNVAINIGEQGITVDFSSSFAGGIVGYIMGGIDDGYNSSHIIENCYTTGDILAYSSVVSASMGSFVGAGGLVGHNNGIIRNCYTIGNIYVYSGSVSAFAGGLVGSNGDTGIIKNCYAIGNVSVYVEYAFSYAGGLTGANRGVIENCYRLSTQTVTAKTINESGTPLTDAQMKDKTNFIGWDFNTVWAIDSSKNNGYPYLR